ncbi:MAG TPA: hypothetical protein VFF53_11645 [Geobacteraceae bacterium]|nr:hypothetical protein [Geobacteraceae bacterium]
MTILRRCLKLTLICLLLAASGCATLEVTPKKSLTPAGDKQAVTLGIQASGDRLREVLQDPETALVKTAGTGMFDKVTMLPPDARFMQPADVRAAYGTDYILSVSIGDISVNGDLNPYWFASLPLVFFKVYAPIVTFEPNVSLEVSLRDARSGTMLMQKQVSENSADHYAPSNPGDKVRKLISRTLNNAMVGILRDSQMAIAAAGKGTR